VDAPAGRAGLRLPRRSDRAQDAADDFDPVVFDLQLHRRVFAELLVSAAVPRVAGHRHGSGAAGRGSAGDGDLAGPLARLHGRGSARVVGYRLYAVEFSIRRILPLYRLAWDAVGGDSSGLG